MFVERLNYYSSIIPLFLLGFSACVCLLVLFKKISKDMYLLAAAISMNAFVQVIQIIVVPEKIYLWTNISAIFFFASMIFTTYAVYKRLNIQTDWQIVSITFVVAEILLFYFTFLNEQFNVRTAIVAIAAFCIFANNLKELIRYRPEHFLDSLLRLSLYLITACIVLRAVLLTIFYHSNPLWVEHHNLIWAITQQISLICLAALVSILISCSIQDTLTRLSRERNLDPLTGLMNRRAFDEHIEILRLDQEQKNHAIIICDIDHFKKINDVYGHSMGDLALKHVAKIMNKAVRKYDEISRIGGEEFLILLHDVERDFAISVAERIRSTIESTPLHKNGQSIEMTVSFGVSFFEDYSEFNQAMQSSDVLLYQAKSLGRNKVQWQLQG